VERSDKTQTNAEAATLPEAKHEQSTEAAFEKVQSHYDRPTILRRFLDSSELKLRVLSRPKTSHWSSRRMAKIDLSLGNWTSSRNDSARRWWAGVRHDAGNRNVTTSVVGLTLSKNQQDFVRERFAESDSPRTKRVMWRAGSSSTSRRSDRVNWRVRATSAPTATTTSSRRLPGASHRRQNAD